MNDSIKNAFECVGQVYEEVSILLQDFDASLIDDGFECLHKTTIATTELSRHITIPRYWFARFAGRYYGLKEQEVKNPILCVGVIFSDAQQKAMEPVLFVGWMRVPGESPNPYESWWFRALYFDSDDRFDISERDETPTEVDENLPADITSTMSFTCKEGLKRKDLPKDGGYFSVPLTSVKTQEHVESLSKKLVSLLPADLSR